MSETASVHGARGDVWDHTGHPEYADLAAPLSAPLGFDAPGVPLLLWDGPIQVAADGPHAPGRVTLTWTRRPRLHWTVDTTGMTDEQRYGWRRAFRSSKTVTVDFGGHPSALPAQYGSEEGGGFDGGDVGDPNASIASVVAHWVCLPRLRATEQLHLHHGDGRWTTYDGRTRVDTHGWTLTIDARHDLSDATSKARSEDSCVVTHVMDVRRSDGAAFTGRAAKELLSGLQFAVSWACGRWVCPVAPVGYDAQGAAVWSEWRRLRADPPLGEMSWWDPTRTEDLLALVGLYLDAWLKTDSQRVLRHATAYALSTVETGVVEQRLVAGFVGLEQLSWDIHVRGHGKEEKNWRRKGEAGRVRQLITSARIPAAIPDSCPGLAAYAHGRNLIDGPAAITSIRDDLIHPKDTTALYEADDALDDAWLLTGQYLDLVLLHRLGYQGHVADRTHRGRWVGDTKLAPWARRRRVGT